MIESAEEFVRLRTSTDPADYQRTVDEELCQDIIERFPHMRSWVAANKQLPMSILRVLAIDPDQRVRSIVCVKTNLNPALIEILSRDSSESVRTGIARRSNTPVEIILKLVKDESGEVREAAIQAFAKRKGDIG